MGGIPTIESLGDLQGKRILLRADLNVPLGKGGVEGASIADDFRIQASRPTIEFLLEAGAGVTVCSHLGRPKGTDPALSMKPVRDELTSYYPGIEVRENLRFDPGEEANDPAFAAQLADGHDFYVNDAFGASHRRHASIVGVPALLPSAGGLTLLDEVSKLTVLLDHPERPYVAIVGGAKVTDKLGLLRALVAKVDAILVGGGMCFTFLAAAGMSVGDSLVEPSQIDSCRHLLETGKIVLPIDLVGLASTKAFGNESGPDAPEHFVGGVPSGYRGLDIGSGSVHEFGRHISSARSILWNGPMGVFEDERFSEGTYAVARLVGASQAYSVVGGGDSAAALRRAGLAGSVSHLSTGGGASLEYLEYGDLVGLAALRHSKEN